RVPIDGHVLDELKCRLVLVVLREIGGHFDWRVEDHVVRELAGDRGPDARILERVGVPTRLLEDVEDPRGLIEGPVQHPGEEENGLMLGRIAALAAPGVVLLPARALPGYEVGVRAALPGVVHRLMRVYRDLMLRGFLHAVAVVPDHGLRVMRVPVAD